MPLKSQAADLLNVLLEAGKLTDEQVAAVTKDAESTGKPVEVLLSEKKLVDEEFLTRARATLHGLQYVDLTTRQLDTKDVNLLPRSVAESTKAVAFEKVDDVLSVGMIDPVDIRARQGLDFYLQSNNIKTKIFIISTISFNYAFKKYEALGKEVEKALEVAKEKLAGPKAKEEKIEQIEEVIKGAPVSRIVSVILRHAYEGNASDIHLEPYGDISRVRYRVDGVLRTSLTLPLYVHPSLVARIKVLANLKLDETSIPQDGRITENF